MKFDGVELIGLIATRCIFISFTQSKTSRIRIINMIGSVLFVVYGCLIGSISVWLLNAACFVLNLYKIIKEKRDIGKIVEE